MVWRQTLKYSPVLVSNLNNIYTLPYRCQQTHKQSKHKQRLLPQTYSAEKQHQTNKKIDISI